VIDVARLRARREGSIRFPVENAGRLDVVLGFGPFKGYAASAIALTSRGRAYLSRLWCEHGLPHAVKSAIAWQLEFALDEPDSLFGEVC